MFRVYLKVSCEVLIKCSLLPPLHYTVTFLFLMWILVSCRYLYLSSIINKTITTQRCDLMLKQNLTAITAKPSFLCKNGRLLQFCNFSLSAKMYWYIFSEVSQHKWQKSLNRKMTIYGKWNWIWSCWRRFQSSISDQSVWASGVE